MKNSPVHSLQYLPIILLGIGICLWMLGYLFIHYPNTCAKLEWISHGAFTCGLGPGAYIYGLAIGMSLIVWSYLLIQELKSSLECAGSQ